ncbi:MAG TPA: hypothetical protein EYN38_06370, partial [Flavobacteriales bacterium]|nr:hypothetical protein [Flavobacteriales bacterium]
MTYLVEVTSDTGCTIIDTLRVVVTGEAPQVFIGGNTNLCFGDSTQVTALPCNVSVEDDFDPGIDGSVWAINNGAANANCGFNSAPNALHFDYTGARETRTIVMDVSGGGSVSFALAIADGSNPCENADINEGVDFEYSTNGTTWNNIFYYDPDVYTTWAIHTWDITTDIPGALSPTTQFRWIQNLNSGSGFDNWSLDDVEIECCGDLCGSFIYQWAPNVGISSTNIANPNFYPTATQTYTLSVTPTGTDCETVKTITINVGPAFAWTSITPDSICKFGQAQIGVSPDPLLGPYTYLWTPALGLSDSSLANPFASPSVTTTYIVAMQSDSGCITFDSVTVNVSGQVPLVDISTSDNNVCPGDVVQLDADIFAITCGPAINGCSALNPPVLHSLGTGITTLFGTPFQGTSVNGRWQTIYKRSDLAAAGIGPGTITRFELNIGSKGSTAPFQGLTISLGCVIDSCLSIPTGWLPTSTQVYGPSVYSTVIGWNSFAFSQPYDWDGQSNIVVEICWSNPSGSSPGGQDELVAQSMSCISVIRSYSNLTPGCSLTPVFTYTMRPNANFFACPAPTENYTYTWTPATGLSSDTIINPLATVNYDITYQLFVDDGDCEGADFIDLFVDSSYYAVATDTFSCDGDSMQIGVQLFGDPPSTSLTCGANATLCTDTPHAEVVGNGTLFLDGFTYPAPYGNWYWGARHQILYSAADLQAAG